MSFLIKSDFNTFITTADLNVITNSTDEIIISAEKSSISEISSYMRQRYNVDKIFSDTLTYSDTTTYRIGDRIIWTPTAFVGGTGSTYELGDIVSYSSTTGDYIYQSLVTGNTDNYPLTGTSFWSNIADNNARYTAIKETIGNKPIPAFSSTTNSYINNYNLIEGWNRTDDLYFKRLNTEAYIKIYTDSAYTESNHIGTFNYNPEAMEFPYKQSIYPGRSTEKRLGGYINIINFIPENTTWSTIQENYFYAGDDRDEQMKMIVVDICLYNLHSRIQPRNIPTFRIERRDDAIATLKMVSKGTIMLDLPTYQRDSELGQNIVFGSEPKLYNFY